MAYTLDQTPSRLKILSVCPSLPFPLIDGGKRGVFCALRSLVERGHRVDFACLSDTENVDGVRALKQFASLEVVLASKAPTVGGALRSLWERTPYDLQRFHNQALAEKVRLRMQDERYDIVQAEGIHAAYYALRLREEFDVPIVLRAHNIHSVNFLRAVDRYANPVLKSWIRFEGERIKRYETNVGRLFDSTLTVSAVDKELMLQRDPGVRVDVVPAGVDIAEFSPLPVQEEPDTVLWIGALGWIPNQDSFWWFYEKIVPLLIRRRPHVKIKVVGSSAPPRITSLRHPNVEIVGFVADVREIMAQTSVCVVPLLIGSGVRIKLLEMFAMGKAVAATSVGCEGLEVRNGEHLLVADTPEEFAAAVDRLLGDPDLRQRLGEASLAHVRSKFSWQAVAEQSEYVYREVIRTHGSRGRKPS